MEWEGESGGQDRYTLVSEDRMEYGETGRGPYTFVQQKIDQVSRQLISILENVSVQLRSNIL